MQLKMLVPDSDKFKRSMLKQNVFVIISVNSQFTSYDNISINPMLGIEAGNTLLNASNISAPGHMSNITFWSFRDYVIMNVCFCLIIIEKEIFDAEKKSLESNHAKGQVIVAKLWISTECE